MTIIAIAPRGSLVEIIGPTAKDSKGREWLLVKIRPGPHIQNGASGWVQKSLSVKFEKEVRKFARITIVNIGSVPLFPGWEPQYPQSKKRVISLNPCRHKRQTKPWFGLGRLCCKIAEHAILLRETSDTTPTSPALLACWQAWTRPR
jgi:hypothetical protein